MESLSDEQLVVLSRQGNMHAFNSLSSRCETSVYRFALRVLGNREDARDVCQEALVKAYLNIEGLRDGTFVSWTLDEYMRLFSGHPAPDEAARSRRIDDVTVSGSIASATMTLRHGADTFTDMFVLVRTDAGWRIANKVYHRH